MTITLKHYARLRDRGISLARKGDLDAASGLLERAYETAKEFGDRGVEDRALCNWVGVRLSHGNCESQLPRLREILNRNADLDTCHLAAYNLAHAYEENREHKKGLFYARIALAHAESVGNEERVATSHNLLGNLLVAESFFEKGLHHYRSALELKTGGPVMLRAMIVQNIGYCHLMLDRPRTALDLLYKSLRILRNHPLMSTQVHLDLALALLEVGKFMHAIRHAARALESAETAGREDEIKNSLYLLGEAANLIGDEDRAREHFSRLQKYFPRTPFLTDFLLATDIRQMVNLRA